MLLLAQDVCNCVDKDENKPECQEGKPPEVRAVHDSLPQPKRPSQYMKSPVAMQIVKATA
jgi:hypothetical protein